MGEPVTFYHRGVPSCPICMSALDAQRRCNKCADYQARMHEIYLQMKARRGPVDGRKMRGEYGKRAFGSLRERREREAREQTPPLAGQDAALPPSDR